MLMTQHDPERLAHEWIEAWNRHDLDAIMAHYADDVVFTSPFITILAKEPSGTLRSASELRAYFAHALETFPALHFELLDVLVGVSSVTLYYRSVNERLAAEVMRLNDQGLIMRVAVHYRDGAKNISK
jgi:hypothetical protein